MQYTKLFFLSASLLVVKGVFSADMPRVGSGRWNVWLQGDVPRENKQKPYAIQLPTAGKLTGLARAIKEQVPMPEGAEITAITLRNDFVSVTADATYNSGDLGDTARIIAIVKMPELSTLKIKDELLGKNTQLTVRKSGQVKDILNAYSKMVTVPANMELIGLLSEDGLAMMESDDPYDVTNFGTVAILPLYTEKQGAPIIPLPSSSSSSSSSSSTPTLREVAPQWFEATSKKTYFMNKYKALESVVGFDESDYDGYVAFKSTPEYGYLLNTILNKMEERRAYQVIDEILQKANEPDNNQLLMQLVQPATVRAIAALQKLCGKGKRLGFQFDEYDKSQLRNAKVDPIKIDPFIKRVSPIEMTIYRFLHSVIGELDEVPVVKDSPLYKVLDTFDHSLNEIKGKR